jgi:hypothetical protein
MLYLLYKYYDSFKRSKCPLSVNIIYTDNVFKLVVEERLVSAHILRSMCYFGMLFYMEYSFGLKNSFSTITKKFEYTNIN